MRIGELLIEQRKVSSAELARVLEDQRRTGQRLASLLIARGLVDFDDASRALGTQRGVPSVLGKHLAARDPALARVIPPELGRGRGVLPIGRSSSGVLVVCARDPSPALQAEVAKAARAQVTLVIVPASRLDELIAEAYGAVPAAIDVEISGAVQEFEVDLGSAVEIPSPAAAGMQPPPPDMDALDPASVRLALADLDDARVTKDPSQSGQMTAMSGVRALPKAPPPTFEATREALERAASRDAATDAAMAFVAGFWIASALLAVRGTTAVGLRGHGPALGAIESLTVSLDQPSTVKAAIDSKRSSIRLYDTPPQRELARRLGSSSMAAAPIIAGTQALAVLVVGEPIHGLGDTERWISELGRLAQLLGQTYERIRGAG